MVTSSADTASSSTMTAGRGARARAIATRWRWPPESRSGNRSQHIRAQPHLAEQLAHPLAARRAADILRHGVEQDALDVPARIERAQRVLVDDRDERAPASAAVTRAAEPTASPCSSTVPASSCSRPSASLAVVVLPDPDSPTMPSVSPAARSNETPSTAAVTVPSGPRKRLAPARGRSSTGTAWSTAARVPRPTGRAAGVGLRRVPARPVLRARAEISARV